MSLDCEPSELTPLRQNISSRTTTTTTTATTTNNNNSNNSQRQIQLTDQQQQLSQRQFSEQIVPLESTIPSEYMSINNNNHPMGSDSSRVDISEPNSQQPFTNPKSKFIMSDTSRILTRIIIDFAVLLCGESFIVFIICCFNVVFLYHLHILHTLMCFHILNEVQTSFWVMVIGHWWPILMDFVCDNHSTIDLVFLSFWVLCRQANRYGWNTLHVGCFNFVIFLLIKTDISHQSVFIQVCVCAV